MKLSSDPFEHRLKERLQELRVTVMAVFESEDDEDVLRFVPAVSFAIVRTIALRIEGHSTD